MAGPWFAVQESGTAWKPIATIWISDGERHVRARVEIQVQLDKTNR